MSLAQKRRLFQFRLWTARTLRYTRLCPTTAAASTFHASRPQKDFTPAAHIENTRIGERVIRRRTFLAPPPSCDENVGRINQ